MNITVLANRDIASNYALNHLLPVLTRDHQVRVFLSSRVGGSAAGSGEIQQLKFYEQGLFNDILFPALSNSSVIACLHTFDQLVAMTGISPIAVLNNINAEEGLARLAATAPDLLLSIRYGGILKDAAIAMARYGVLNLHSGLLPQYRGVMATFYAMLNGEDEIGMTLHTICDAGIDTGDVIGTTRVGLELQHSYWWNVLQLYPAGVALMLAAVEEISGGNAPDAQPQTGDGQYYSFPKPEQLLRFHNMGLKLFDAQETTTFARQYLE